MPGSRKAGSVRRRSRRLAFGWSAPARVPCRFARCRAATAARRGARISLKRRSAALARATRSLGL